MEFSYQVRLLDPAYHRDLVEAFKKLDRFADVVLLMQRTTIEL